jgi:hypothetical protein
VTLANAGACNFPLADDLLRGVSGLSPGKEKIGRSKAA